MTYSSVAEAASFVPQEMCWSVLSASPHLLPFPSTDIKFITCLYNGCHIWFSYFGEEKRKEEKKRFTGDTLQTGASQVRGPAYEWVLLLLLKRYGTWSSFWPDILFSQVAYIYADNFCEKRLNRQ